MNPIIKGTRSTMIVVALILAIFSISYANSNHSSLSVNPSVNSVVNYTVAGDYSFKVHNNTNSTIKQVLVSEDGKNFGSFDIGNGIAPGETEELVWDTSTNGESCHQYFKAVFADGSESQAVKFDFCESGLVLEF